MMYENDIYCVPGKTMQDDGTCGYDDPRTVEWSEGKAQACQNGMGVDVSNEGSQCSECGPLTYCSTTFELPY